MVLAGTNGSVRINRCRNRKRGRGGTRRAAGAGGIYGAGTSARAYECGVPTAGGGTRGCPGSGG